MTERQLHSREDFEQFLADPSYVHQVEAQAGRQARNRQSAIWFMGTFGLITGVILFLHYPGLFGDKRTTAERNEDRISWALSWFDVDYRAYKRKQEREWARRKREMDRASVLPKPIRLAP